MAYGTELVLGFEPAMFGRVCTALNVPVKFSDEPTDAELSEFQYLKLETIDEKFRAIHHQCCLDMGWTPLKKKKPRFKNDDYPIYETSKGPREFAPFRLELFYDPGEMGEDPEHAILGVALSGRYFPTFLDWKDPHGGVQFVFNTELNNGIAAARLRLIEGFEIFDESLIAIKEIHY